MMHELAVVVSSSAETTIHMYGCVRFRLQRSFASIIISTYKYAQYSPLRLVCRLPPTADCGAVRAHYCEWWVRPVRWPWSSVPMSTGWGLAVGGARLSDMRAFPCVSDDVSVCTWSANERNANQSPWTRLQVCISYALHSLESPHRNIDVQLYMRVRISSRS